METHGWSLEAIDLDLATWKSDSVFQKKCRFTQTSLGMHAELSASGT